MTGADSALHEGLPERAGRMATRIALLGLAALSALGAVGALFALLAHLSFVRWGWPGALGALTACLLVSAGALLLVAKGMRRRAEARRAAEIASAAYASGDDPSSTPALPAWATLFVEMARAGGSPRPGWWLTLASLGAGALAVIGPRRAWRIGRRAVRIAASLYLVGESLTRPQPRRDPAPLRREHIVRE